MYDDASYYTFVPSAYAQNEKPPVAKHVRKTSLLAQPSVSRLLISNHGILSDHWQEGVQANGGLIGGTLAGDGSHEEIKGPPKATLSRRAQSYSDFHYSVRAVLEPEWPARGKSKKEAEGVKDDLSFSDWYQCLEEELLEASHGDYK